jgi:hypothetical protein
VRQYSKALASTLAFHVVVVVTWALCTTGSFLDCTLAFCGRFTNDDRVAQFLWISVGMQTRQCSAVVAKRDETSIPLFGSDTAGEADGDLLDDDFLVNTIEGTDDGIRYKT